MRLLLHYMKYVVPGSLVVGAGVELFMNNTGFYEIVTKKAAERYEEQQKEYERQLNRMRELGINVDADDDDDDE